jgi:hypothetical protein
MHELSVVTRLLPVVAVQVSLDHDEAVNRPLWTDVSEDWEDEGGLRDVFVFETKVGDWQRLLDLFRSRWPSTYSEDGNSETMPADVQTIFQVREKRAVRWQIQAAPRIHINCHFFWPEEIEFDLDPRQINTQADFDVVCEFIRSIGAILQKTVSVCWEGDARAEIMRYDPETDVIRRVVAG